jgi:hypothetical protein
VEFLIAHKYPLTIFVNHWPSLANPDSWRITAAEVLLKRTLEIMQKNPHMNIIALGDFNTIDTSSPHPFKTVLERNQVFSDVEKISEKKKTSEGTYYFAPKNQWSSLDHFFINKNLKGAGQGLKIDKKSFVIYSPQFITHLIRKRSSRSYEDRSIKEFIAPKRFNPKANDKENMGYSDHFPILVKLTY